MNHEWSNISITIGLFLLTHIMTTIWWASKTNTILDIVQKDLKELIGEIKATRQIFVTKEEYAKDHGILEKENKAMWDSIEKLRDTVNWDHNNPGKK